MGKKVNNMLYIFRVGCCKEGKGERERETKKYFPLLLVWEDALLSMDKRTNDKRRKSGGHGLLAFPHC